MNGKYKIYLKEVFDDIKHYAGGSKHNSTLLEVLRDKNKKEIDMSNVVLDIQDIIITPSVEKLLYSWMTQYGLDVVDTTVEGWKTRWVDAKDGKPGYFEKYYDETPIKFRDEAFKKHKKQLKDIRLAVDIKKFLYLNENNASVFDFEHSAKTLVNLVNERIKAKNPNKLIINIDGFPIDDESVREFSALMIRLNNYVKISYNDVLGSATCRFKILPAVSQLCFDFSSPLNAWEDIKYKFPEGSTVYFSSTSSNYIKAKVIKNLLVTAEGKSLREYEGNIPKEYYDDYYEIELSYEDEIIDEFNNKTIEHKTYLVRYSNISAREILIFPPNIFGDEDTNGMPNKDEMKKFFRDNEILERKEVMLNYNDLIYVNSRKPLTMDTNWIKACREQEQIYHAKRGETIDFIDLEEVILGTYTGNIKPINKPEKSIR